MNEFKTEPSTNLLPCLCGREEETVRLTYPGADSHELAPEAIDWCECCQWGRAFPMMDDDSLTELYEGGEYWGESAGPVTAHFQVVPFAMARSRWKMMSAFAEKVESNSVQFVDVGAGQGCLGLVSTSASKQLKYTAVEPDESWHQPLLESAKKERVADRVSVVSKLSDLSEPADLIVLAQVLEHVNDPIGYLKELKSHLKPDGYILVDVPHVDFKFKSDVFPHLLFFTPKSLKLAMEEAGFEVNQSDAWGLPNEKSPLNANYTSPFKWLAWLLAGGARRVPPLASVAIPFIEWYFGASQKNATGNWVRAIGKNPVV